MVVLAATSPLSAQSNVALEFMGFRPGMSSADVQARISALGGKWSCSTSKVDLRFSECRGTLNAEDGLSRFAIRYMCTHHYFSIERARRELGYVPRVSIAEGIERTARHLEASGEVACAS